MVSSMLTRGQLKDDINFVLTKRYKLWDVGAVAAKAIGMTIDTEDNIFTVSEVESFEHIERGSKLVYSLNIHWVGIRGLQPPSPHPEFGSPIHPLLYKYCTLVQDE